MTESDDETLATDRVPVASAKRLRPGKVGVRVVVGSAEGSTFELTGAAVTVGRSKMADLTIGERSLSGLHFELVATKTGARLRDLDSTNGTFFGGRRVVEIELEVGDEFRAGSCQFVLTAVSEVEVETLELESFGQLRGSSLVMRELFAQLSAIGRTPLDVLIIGETGTGKELSARALHDLSARGGRKGPFVVLDCGALSPTLAESTMFGFRKGTFTGADRDQPGVFEAADGGTIFIDEIGELDRELQTRLLRVLDAREVNRLGEPGRFRPVDVRVVAATHRDLREAVERKAFRRDLYYRLARSLVCTPPLRERGEDVVLLAEAFLGRLSADHDIAMGLSESAKRALLRHRWPGNVRELRNVIEQAAYIKRSGMIEASDLRLGSVGAAGPALPLAKLVGGSKRYDEFHADLDRVLLPRLLDEFDHNLTKLAKALGISRDKLRSRLKALGLYASSRGGRPPS